MKLIKMNYNGEISVNRQMGHKLPFLDVKDGIGSYIAHVGFRNKEDVEELIKQLRETMT